MRLAELIWFQLLTGAKPNQIESNLIAYRQLRADASSTSRSHREEHARMHHERELESRRCSRTTSVRWWYRIPMGAYLKQIALAKSIKTTVETPTPTERGCCGFHTRSIIGRPRVRSRNPPWMKEKWNALKLCKKRLRP